MVSRSQFLADKPQVPAETVGFGPGIRLMPFHSWGEVIVSAFSVGIKWDGLSSSFCKPCSIID